MILLICARIRECVKENVWTPEKDDRITVALVEFEQLVRQVRREQGAGFIKSLRDMADGEFVRCVENEMMLWRFLWIDVAAGQVTILPAAGKISGGYPQDYRGAMNDEQ